MAIELNHTIVPAHDKVASATFFARIFGLPYKEDSHAYFAAVRVNGSLTLDFANSMKFEPHHFAFKVSEDDFDVIFTRTNAGVSVFSQRANRLLEAGR